MKILVNTEENLESVSRTEQLTMDTKYRKSRIKEMTYTFNFGENNVVNAETERINGVLKSVIIDIGESQNLRIVIVPKDYPFIKILDANLKLSGAFYLATPSTGVHGSEMITPNLMEWVLNDILSIYMEGPKNAEVKVVIRYA